MEAEAVLAKFATAMRAVVREEVEAGLARIKEHHEPEAVTYREAGRLLSVSERTIRRMARAGQLLLVHVGDSPKVPMSEVRRISNPSPGRSAMPEVTRKPAPSAAPAPRRRSAAMPESAKVRAALKAKRQR